MSTENVEKLSLCKSK